MNIVYSSSDSYAECTGVSLWSLLNANKHIEEINIYILAVDISLQNQEKLKFVAKNFKRRICIIDAKEDFVATARAFNLPLMRGAYSTYSRICLNKWFSRLDKVLVVDGDTLVCGSLKELWDTDLSGKLIGAVPEVAMYGEINNIEDKDILNNVDVYYNMGICLVNLNEWRMQKIDSLLAKRIREETRSFKVADQSVINKYLNDYIVRVPLKFNYYSVVHSVTYGTIEKVFNRKKIFSKQEFENARKDIRIIHYFGHPFERPWFRFNAAYKKNKYSTIRNETPWNGQNLKKWNSSKNVIIRVYDVCCYLLLLLGLRDFCLKFRYYYGQKIKGMLKISR